MFLYTYVWVWLHLINIRVIYYIIVIYKILIFLERDDLVKKISEMSTATVRDLALRSPRAIQVKLDDGVIGTVIMDIDKVSMEDYLNVDTVKLVETSHIAIVLGEVIMDGANMTMNGKMIKNVIDKDISSVLYQE